MQSPISRRVFLFGKAPNRPTGNPALDLVANRSVATAIEYGLIAALVAVAIIPGLTRLGRRSRRKFNCVQQTMRKGERGGACK